MGSSEFFSEGITLLSNYVTGLLESFGGVIGQVAEAVSTWVGTL